MRGFFLLLCKQFVGVFRPLRLLDRSGEFGGCVGVVSGGVRRIFSSGYFLFNRLGELLCILSAICLGCGQGILVYVWKPVRDESEVYGWLKGFGGDDAVGLRAAVERSACDVLCYLFSRCSVTGYGVVVPWL